jgi:hypothetical protein
MGRAINKAVTIAEILKRKMALHQITSLSSCEIVDVFEPLEEGLDVVESRRYVSCMAITLSIDGVGMDVNDIGYQVRHYICLICRKNLDPFRPMKKTQLTDSALFLSSSSVCWTFLKISPRSHLKKFNLAI